MCTMLLWNQLENHLLKDQEEDQEEAKTRVPLKQLRRKQKPLEKNDPEAGPGNGRNKWFRRSLLRKRLKKLKRHPHKNLQRKTKRPHHSISTSSAVGSFEGRRRCLDHLFSMPWSFHLCLGGKKSHNLKKDYINHLLFNPFTVPGLVKNCCNTKGTQITDATFNYGFLFS
nr:high mobility group protein HMGI-C isoform X1 [Pelodiscus sinensis]|eukprot:XP_025044044.1 high mobility group protein HMGI-C isoform X1 [Pelodiscus sinensis]